MTVTVKPKLTWKLTEAQRRALLAVKAGQVVQIFDRKGNHYRGPNGPQGSRIYRVLAEVRLIEEVPGQKVAGPYYSCHKQQLTEAGRKALGDT